ncbi:MAG TPA: hypothetical protein DCE44_23755, partial [Verrucomicrobiales bacterium]|nr:hypothetical protein [Verrucomicrobiales bacterium]
KLRRHQARRVLLKNRDRWPVDELSCRKPPSWPGWPGQRQFAFILTHDVEGPTGLERVRDLAELELSLGFRSSFNFIPEGAYAVPDNLRSWLTSHGFEVGVHDRHHDGKLYSSRATFRSHAARINHYLREWNAVGFRSGFMHHRLAWLHDLKIDYDASTFDIDPFEPQPDGMSTMFPFWVPNPLTVSSQNGHDPNLPILGSLSPTAPSSLNEVRKGYVELPYTLTQDSTLFRFLQEPDCQIWVRKLAWIAEHGGMALVNVHPDYIDWPSGKLSQYGYPLAHYRSLLEHVRECYSDSAWQALPHQVSTFVREAYNGTGPRKPRHIGMVSYSGFESDNRVQRYAQALAQQGDIINVLALAGTDASPTPAPVADSGIRIHHVRRRKRDERTKLDFLVRVLKFCWQSSRLLIRLHRLQPFDLIHVHNVPDFLVFVTWYPRLFGTRIILDLHDLLPEFYQSKFNIESDSITFKLLLSCERVSCRYADHVIVSNDLWQQRVATRSAAPGRCSAMVNHVDETLFRPRQSTKVGANPIVIFPGGLQRHQGVHVAVRAFKTLIQKHPTARLHVVGDGPDLEALLTLTESLGLTEVVTFFPTVPLGEVSLLLHQADVGVVPKLAEGFGNEAYSTKIMEFMASGLPVVASRTRIDEYYYGQGQVYFFRSGDPEDLARALGEVISDPLLRAQLVARGLEYSNKNNWSQHSKEYTSLVDRLLAEREVTDVASKPSTAGHFLEAPDS